MLLPINVESSAHSCPVQQCWLRLGGWVWTRWRGPPRVLHTTVVAAATIFSTYPRTAVEKRNE